VSERIKSAYRVSYAATADIPEAEFARVFRQLKLACSDEESLARDVLKSILDEFHTRSKAVAHSASQKTDIKDLEELLSRIREADVDSGWWRVAEFIRELRGTNPVLRERLRLSFGKGGLGDPQVLEQLDDHERIVAGLLEEIETECRSGRRSDAAGVWLVNWLFDFWIRFTRQATSRINWRSDVDKGPFPDFVRAAGKLVDPHFNGVYYARQIHDESKASLDARRAAVEQRWPRKV
jgi:hypothetical protein